MNGIKKQHWGVGLTRLSVFDIMIYNERSLIFNAWAIGFIDPAKAEPFHDWCLHDLVIPPVEYLISLHYGVAPPWSMRPIFWAICKSKECSQRSIGCDRGQGFIFSRASDERGLVGPSASHHCFNMTQRWRTKHKTGSQRLNVDAQLLPSLGEGEALTFRPPSGLYASFSSPL